MKKIYVTFAVLLAFFMISSTCVIASDLGLSSVSDESVQNVISEESETGEELSGESTSAVTGGETQPASMGNQAPHADFVYSQDEDNEFKFYFFSEGHSYDPDGTIIYWEWDFGDSSYSYEQNPVHTYSEQLAGDSIEVTLWVGDDGDPQEFDDVSKYIQLPEGESVGSEEIQGSITPVAVNEEQSSSSAASTSGTSSTQTVSTGESETGEEISSEPTSSVPGGDTQPASMGNQAPHADFVYSQDEDNEFKFYFFSEGHSYDPDGTIIYWEWDFGDSSYSYEQNPVHTYSEQLAGDSIEVTLWVGDDGDPQEFDDVSKYIQLPDEAVVVSGATTQSSGASSPSSQQSSYQSYATQYGSFSL